MIASVRALRAPQMPTSRPPNTPSGTATTIDDSVTIALSPLAEHGEIEEAQSDQQREPLVARVGAKHRDDRDDGDPRQPRQAVDDVLVGAEDELESRGEQAIGRSRAARSKAMRSNASAP